MRPPTSGQYMVESIWDGWRARAPLGLPRARHPASPDAPRPESSFSPRMRRAAKLKSARRTAPGPTGTPRRLVDVAPARTQTASGVGAGGPPGGRVETSRTAPYQKAHRGDSGERSTPRRLACPSRRAPMSSLRPSQSVFSMRREGMKANCTGLPQPRFPQRATTSE